MGKPTICIGENKGADQLRSYCEAHQRLCFHCTDSTILLPLKSEISSFLPASVDVQPGLCQTWSETQIVGFLTHSLIYSVTLQLWDLRTLSVVQEYKGHTEAIEACIFLPTYRNDGRNLLATCSRDTSVRIWDRDTKGTSLNKLIIQRHIC